ncbi:phosphotransferase [Streptomyces sp. NPDC088732]|uniref:phosphotransferase n=1 Tax=Streptomyces sp. NPDC088732 TaxID=3365879 RepID=UPI003815EBC1
MPEAVRRAVEYRLGSPVVAAEPQTGGFSRGVAARLRCADGSRAFVKAVDREADPVTVALAEQEAVVAAALTPDLGLPAPAFLGRVDHGTWTALLFEDVAGRMPVVPWRQDDLTRTIDALTALTALTVPAIANLLPALPVWGGSLEEWEGWNSLLDADDSFDDVPSWARRNVRNLAAAETEFPAAAAGGTLLHSDLRSDNILITRDRVTFVDWAWAAQGQDWIDPMIFALCAAVQGHPDPQTIFLAHPAGRSAPPAAVDSVLAALAGRFVVAARQPAVWNTASIRAFQRAEAETSIRWLRTRTRWN